MAEIEIEKTDPHHAQDRLATNEFDCFSARSVMIDGNEILVMIYGNGPTAHINMVERAIEAMPKLQAIVSGRSSNEVGS